MTTYTYKNLCYPPKKKNRSSLHTNGCGKIQRNLHLDIEKLCGWEWWVEHCVVFFLFFCLVDILTALDKGGSWFKSCQSKGGRFCLSTSKWLKSAFNILYLLPEKYQHTFLVQDFPLSNIKKGMAFHQKWLDTLKDGLFTMKPLILSPEKIHQPFCRVKNHPKKCRFFCSFTMVKVTWNTCSIHHLFSFNEVRVDDWNGCQPDVWEIKIPVRHQKPSSCHRFKFFRGQSHHKCSGIKPYQLLLVWFIFWTVLPDSKGLKKQRSRRGSGVLILFRKIIS